MKKKRSLFMFVILLFALGLITASVTMAGSGPSWTTNPHPVTTPGHQAPAIATGGTITITHSTSQVINMGNSVSCNLDGIHVDNSYYRVFDLANDFGIVGVFNVTAVQYGIEQANSPSLQPVDVNLYTLNGVLNTANLTPIGDTTNNVPSQLRTIFTSLVTGTVPPGGVLVVEVFTPNGKPGNNSFYIGSNPHGQSDPSYLRAPDCGAVQPIAAATIGFPNMHIVINVIGNEGGPPTDVSLSSIAGQTSESFILAVLMGGLGLLAWTVIVVRRPQN